jgi:dimeric dUTPase (all-alpha-NTP-PPase superfamily)
LDYLARSKHLVQLQDDLNEATIANWVSNGNDWETAIVIECAEAIDSTPWKWWKSMDADIANLKVETIDTLHFLISKAMNDLTTDSPVREEYIDDVTHSLANALRKHPAKTEVQIKGIKELYKKLMLSTLKQGHMDEYLEVISEIFACLGMGIDDIYASYISKNLLNHFRQERGYKSPDVHYTKVFADGREDNAVFFDVVMKVAEDHPDVELHSLKELVFSEMDAKVFANSEKV